MNIKSLLLGSAAALVAVSGARAADAVVVAEPEPMDYVRICDTYGEGFYYIPGTETCLNIGGYARYQINFNDNDDGWRKLARAELWFDARSETEYGTLTGYIELRGNVNTPNSTSGLNVLYATITLGGLSMGLYDTLYDYGLSLEQELTGAYDSVHYINYTFEGSGFAATIGVEEADNNYDYTPNITAKVSVKQDWGSITGYVAYDATAEETSVKVVGSFKPADAFTVTLMGIYDSGISFYSTGYEWSAGGTVKYQATDKLALTVGGQYYADDYITGEEEWMVGAVVDYTIVPNFAAKLALAYHDGDNLPDSYFDGFLRFTRSF